MKRYFLSAVLITMLGVCNVWADWPQYLGPNRNATSDEKGLLRSWPAEGPKVLWTFDLGPGYGGGAISKGKVYLIYTKECWGPLALSDGKLLIRDQKQMKCVDVR